MSKLNIKVIQTCDEEKLLPSLMAISTKYALAGYAVSGRTGGAEVDTSGQKEHDQSEHDHRDQDQPEHDQLGHPSSERAGR